MACLESSLRRHAPCPFPSAVQLPTRRCESAGQRGRTVALFPSSYVGTNVHPVGDIRSLFRCIPTLPTSFLPPSNSSPTRRPESICPEAAKAPALAKTYLRRPPACYLRVQRWGGGTWWGAGIRQVVSSVHSTPAPYPTIAAAAASPQQISHTKTPFYCLLSSTATERTIKDDR